MLYSSAGFIMEGVFSSTGTGLYIGHGFIAFSSRIVIITEEIRSLKWASDWDAGF